jgi:hypothetical protein
MSVTRRIAVVMVYMALTQEDYKIGNCYFSAEHAALRSKSKDWLVGIRIM